MDTNKDQKEGNQRCIYKMRRAWRICIPTPDGGTEETSIGYIIVGKEKSLAYAIQIRDKLGTKHWGCFWPDILKDTQYLRKLPRSFEPLYGLNKDRNGEIIPVYRASWSEYRSDGTWKRRLASRSIERYGKQEAYDICKSLMLEGSKNMLPILAYLKSKKHPRYADIDLTMPNLAANNQRKGV